MCIGAGLKFLHNNLVLRPNDLVLTRDNRKLVAVEIYTTGRKKPKFNCRLYDPASDSLVHLTPSQLQPGRVGRATPQQLRAIEALLERLTDEGAMRPLDEPEQDTEGADVHPHSDQENVPADSAAIETVQNDQSERCACFFTSSRV